MIMTLSLCLLAYIVGSIPTGYWLARAVAHVDIRQEGSGNIGATNVGRVLGLKLGRLTLLGDMAKGFCMVQLALWLAPSPLGVWLTAFAAFLGHCYSCFLGGKGGKGVAVAAGNFLALAPLPTAVVGVVWLVIKKKTGKASLAALVATPLLPILLLAQGQPTGILLLAVATVAVIVRRHKDNIVRLKQGLE